MKTRLNLILGATLLILVALSASTAPLLLAQGTATPAAVSDDAVNKVSKGLYCPVCQNTPLDVCQTEACARWREQVRDLIAKGYTEDQIRQYFIEHFGPQTVGTATDTTSKLTNFVLPFALIGLIGIVVVWNLISWRRNRALVASITPQSKPAPPTDNESGSHDPNDEYRARLERELKERD